MIFQINLHDDRPIIKEGNHSILVGTGSPSTIHQHGPLPFMGRQFAAQQNLRGLVSAESLTVMVGIPVTTLMGMDIISQFRVGFSYQNATLDFTDGEVEMPGTPVPLTQYMGIPIVEVQINDKPRRMYIESGNRLSYLSTKHTAGMVSVGTEKDYYPGHGHFTTPVYPIETRLAGHSFPVRYGNLPPELAHLLTMARADGILGSDLFHAFDLGLDMRASRLFVSLCRGNPKLH